MAVGEAETLKAEADLEEVLSGSLETSEPLVVTGR
jgi:hypothetical protein